MDGDGPQSAYGLVFLGLPTVAELLPAGTGEDGPRITIRARSGRGEVPELRLLDGSGGVRLLADGRVLALDRAGRVATFFGPRLPPELLAHPYLAPVATGFSRWEGREAFHAGAFVAAGRAWVVLGPRTAGKSSLMAAMAARGLPVLSDDIVVTDGSVVYRGPRCIDLRQPLPAYDLEVHRARLDSRWRVRLPFVEEKTPLGGWLFLHWDNAISVEPVGPSRLVGRLAGLRAFADLTSDPAVLLALATRPAWDLKRPRDWAALDDTLDLIESVLTTGVGVDPGNFERGAQAAVAVGYRRSNRPQ